MDNDQNQNENQKEIEEIRRFIATTEISLESARAALSKLTGVDIILNKDTINTGNGVIYSSSIDGKVIEGIFDGENMTAPDGNIFPVPANYASKSKLIEGDKLKLTIVEDGSFIFKQIGPISRKKIIGTLVTEDNAFHVTAEGKNYNVLYASVTYFKAKPGDRVTIVVPESGDSHWGAIENVIHDTYVKEDVEESQVYTNGLPSFPDLGDERSDYHSLKIEDTEIPKEPDVPKE
jgi:hypothetical protein